MGGIAGLIRFDGQAVTEPDSSNIVNLLKHRGPIISHPVNQGMLWAFNGKIDVNKTTQTVATIDANVFGKSAPDWAFTPTYSQQTTTFFNELNADFAVAIWDAHQQTLCLSRDAMGIKPVYYIHQPGRFFAFASEIKALLALREVVVKPNEYKFIEYLTWPTQYVPYSAETFYENIFSVLPGHYLLISAQKLTLYPYWTVDIKKFSGLQGPEAYSSLFKDYFMTAVSDRMAERKLVGAHLSGGLDSSSVSCVAQHVLSRQFRPALHTFNIDTEQPFAEEQEYVQAVVDQYDTRHHHVRPLADVLDSILKINHLFDRPEHFIIPSSFHISVSIQAQQLGCDLLLTGHDGDSVIATSFEYLDQLFDAHEWEDFQLSSQEFIANYGRNLKFLGAKWPQLSDQVKLQKYILHTIGSTIKKQLREQPVLTSLATWHHQKLLFGIPTTAVVAYVYDRLLNKWTHRAQIDNAFTPDFKQRFPHRRQQSTENLAASLSTDQYITGNQILNTTNVICNEQFNHIGAYYGHEYSFPFFDKNIMELGLATPLAVGFDHGRGRGLIRNGLAGILPSKIVSRITKANFVEYGNLTARQLYEVTYDQFASSSHAIWGVIDKKEFTKILNFVVDPGIPVARKTRYNLLLSRIMYLALWLGSLPQSKQ